MVSISRMMSVARTLSAAIPASLTRAPLVLPSAPTGESASRFAGQPRPAAKHPQLRVRETLDHGLLHHLTTWDAQLLALKVVSAMVDGNGREIANPAFGGKVLHEALESCRNTKGLAAARKLYAELRVFDRVGRVVGDSTAIRANDADRWLRQYDPTVISAYDTGEPVDLEWLRKSTLSLTGDDPLEKQQLSVLAVLAAAFPAADVIADGASRPYWHPSTVQVSYDRSYDILVHDAAMYDRVMDNIDLFEAVPGLRNIRVLASNGVKRDEAIGGIVAEALAARAPEFTLAQVTSLGGYGIILSAPTDASIERISEVMTFIHDLAAANGVSKAQVRLDRY